MKRRLLSFVLAFAMLLSVTPVAVFAAGDVIDTESELAAALTTGGEVKLGGNIEVATMIEIPAGVNAVLDLNGYAITSGYQTGSDSKHIYPLSVYGMLTIKDSGENGSISGRGIYVQNNSTLFVVGGTIYGIDANGGSALYQYGGDIYITGGVVEQTANYTYNYAIYAGGGTITISGGKIVGKHGALSVSGANATVTGGEFICLGNEGWTDNVVYVSAGSLTVNGGTFTHKGAETNADSGAALVATSGATKVAISGGSFTGLNGAMSSSAATTVVTGGVFVNGDYSPNHYGDVSEYVPDDYKYDSATGSVSINADLIINTVDDLKAFRDEVNSGNTYSGKFVVLGADLDLANEAWTPIGLDGDSIGFAGTFNGQGHVISNLNVDTTDGADNAAGLFGSVRGILKNFTVKNASVKNIVTEDPTVDGTAVIAGCTGYGATIDNVHVVNAIVESNRYVAGVSGYAAGTFTNCSVENLTVVATPNEVSAGQYDNGDKAGGIIGYVNSSATAVSGCTLAGNVTIEGYCDMGGLVGCVNNSTTLTSNVNNANLTILVDTSLCGERDNYNIGEFYGRNTPAVASANNTTGVAGSYVSGIDYDPNAKNYVSLGDSMSNGYGLPGYNANNGVEDYGNESYANQFAEYYGFNHAQLAMSAMRAEDLHWLLEVDYNNLAVISELAANGWNEDKWNSVFTNGDYWTWKELVNDYRFDIAAAYIENLQSANGVELNCIKNDTNMTDPEKDAIYKHYSDVEALQVVAEYYQTSVKNADVISLGMGNGNFGVFMFGRIMEAIGFDGTPDEAMIYDVERAIAECPANIQHEILVLKDQLYAKVESMVGMSIESNPTLEALANTVVYTGLSYVLNYAGSVEAILQRNPDAEIILVALMNTFGDNEQAARAIPGVEDATIGDLLNVVFTPLNAYIAALPTYMQATGNSVYANATFYYAEADNVECMVETYGDDFYNADGTSNCSSTIRDRFVTDIVGTENDHGMVWKMLEGVELVDGITLVPVTFKEICDYDDMTPEEKAVYAVNNQPKAVSIAVYLAFEDAIKNAADGAPVSISSVLGLGTIMSGGTDIFSGVMTEFNNNIGNNAASADNINAACGGMVTVINAVVGHQLVTQEQVIAIYNGNPANDSTVAQIASVLKNANINVKSSVDMLCMLLALPETLSEAVQNDTSLQGLLGLFARCIVGNGLGGHPSENGHNTLAAAVINAYDNGYTAEDQTKENLKVVIPAAYAQAYQYALANGYIDMAKGYIGIASGALGTANTFVSTLEVPAQLLNTKALLLEEMANTQATLAKIHALLSVSELTPETWAQILAMENELYTHMATLEDLAAELGVVGNIALDQISIVVNHYSALVDTVANNAYAWVANGVTEFNAEYAAWVESVGLAADKIDPELGAAVRAYLSETPAEALAIMYAAGDDAVVEFIAATAAASDDIKVIITAISAILESDINAIATAVKNSAEVAAILAQIDQVKGEIEATVAEMQKYPVSSALAYQQILDQLQKQLAILQGQLVDAILNSIDDVDPTLRPLLNKALTALDNAIGVAANYGEAYGVWFEARFDEMLGDLLALLIDKTDEFGSIAGPILGETIDNFLHYVGDLAYEKGMEILDKVENEVIPAFIDTLKDYGAQAWAKLMAKLDALGVLDAVDQAQKDLNGLYELINSYITEDLTDAYDTVLDRIGEIKENIADLIETVRTELANTSEEELRATLAALQEKLENLYNAILALENVVNEAIHGNINTAIAMAQGALNNVAAAAADLAGVLSEDAAAAVADLANDVKAMLNDAYIDAITDAYTVSPDSYYVALGDSSVYGEDSYAQKLAAELGLTTSQFINLSAAGMSVAETIGLVHANASEIAKADLITIGYSNNTMMEFVIAQLKAATGNGEAQPMDWTALVGEKLVPHVEKALADITADMLASGVDTQYAELLSVAVEAYAYAAVSHALNYPMVVGSIHEINPDALVVIVGMYNPLAGVSVKLSSTETIEIGDYVQKLIDLANMETLAYAMLAPNTIYVDAPNVTTQAQPGEIPVVNFLMGLLMNGTDKYYATEDGHAYIAQQILNALTVTKTGLLGDADNDGVVDSYDVTLILQYLADYIGKEDINYAVCDVDGDGFVDSYDVTLILQYLAEYITSFPAEIQ